MTARQNVHRLALRIGPARAIAAAALLLAHLVWVFPAYAQLAIQREARLKAGFIYHFAVFAEWPVVNVERDLRICVVGRDPFEGQLDALLDGKRVSARTVKVLILGRSQESDVTQCDVAFVSGSERDELRDVLTTLRRRPVLTISDIPQFARLGGMIGLTSEGQTIHFEINRGVAEDAGLRLSAKLLQLATVVSIQPHAAAR
jgi:uncharacterized protein DUF4154